MAELLLGCVLSYEGDPFEDTGAARLSEAVLVDGGLIRAVGTAAALRAANPAATVTDYGKSLQNPRMKPRASLR